MTEKGFRRCFICELICVICMPILLEIWKRTGNEDCLFFGIAFTFISAVCYACFVLASGGNKSKIASFIFDWDEDEDEL